MSESSVQTFEDDDFLITAEQQSIFSLLEEWHHEIHACSNLTEHLPSKSDNEESFISTNESEYYHELDPNCAYYKSIKEPDILLAANQDCPRQSPVITTGYSSLLEPSFISSLPRRDLDNSHQSSQKETNLFDCTASPQRQQYIFAPKRRIESFESMCEMLPPMPDVFVKFLTTHYALKQMTAECESVEAADAITQSSPSVLSRASCASFIRFE
eukprot:TRINITY_DN1373_c0_g1_i16.p1 TRINITY_DN1373_c0_g1~~TRINITY_DN1373_c0_g1_i16.p1  ORF type:complete len:214 (-),score=40.85 TRINITY_DN1373_c0_g1_i16:632-1273(-)